MFPHIFALDQHCSIASSCKHSLTSFPSLMHCKPRISINSNVPKMSLVACLQNVLLHSAIPALLVTIAQLVPKFCTTNLVHMIGQAFSLNRIQFLYKVVFCAWKDITKHHLLHTLLKEIQLVEKEETLHEERVVALTKLKRMVSHAGMEHWRKCHTALAEVLLVPLRPACILWSLLHASPPHLDPMSTGVQRLAIRSEFIGHSCETRDQLLALLVGHHLLHVLQKRQLSRGTAARGILETFVGAQCALHALAKQRAHVWEDVLLDLIVQRMWLCESVLVQQIVKYWLVFLRCKLGNVKLERVEAHKGLIVVCFSRHLAQLSILCLHFPDFTPSLNNSQLRPRTIILQKQCYSFRTFTHLCLAHQFTSGMKHNNVTYLVFLVVIAMTLVRAEHKILGVRYACHTN